MIQQMTPRERTLATFVGVLVAGLVAIMLGKTFMRNYNTLTLQLRTKTMELASMKTLIVERDLWVQRDQLLSSKQPHLENAGSAAVNFHEELKNLASEHSVMIDQPSLGMVDSSKPHYQAVRVGFETKSNWPDLVDFLHTAQNPDKFIVFTSVTIEVAKNDPSQMHGKFNAERWFAPK
jgi:hypothetical protein